MDKKINNIIIKKISKHNKYTTVKNFGVSTLFKEINSFYSAKIYKTDFKKNHSKDI